MRATPWCHGVAAHAARQRQLPSARPACLRYRGLPSASADRAGSDAHRRAPERWPCAVPRPSRGDLSRLSGAVQLPRSRTTRGAPQVGQGPCRSGTDLRASPPHWEGERESLGDGVGRSIGSTPRRHSITASAPPITTASRPDHTAGVRSQGWAVPRCVRRDTPWPARAARVRSPVCAGASC
jgi:hypothetical protein